MNDNMLEQFQTAIAVELEELKALTLAAHKPIIYTEMDTRAIVYPNTISGVDISRWQVNTISPPGTFDFDKLSNQGKCFVIYRATVGADYTDPRLTDYVNSNRRVPCAGDYAVVWLDRDIQAQAEFYLSKIDGLPPARSWIDLEGAALTITPIEAAKNLHVWLRIVESSTGFIPGIYTSKLWFDKNIAPSSLWQRYPLWAARYPGDLDLDGPWGDGKYIFRDWETFTLWQYTDRGD